MTKIRFSNIDFISISAFRFYVRQGLNVTLEYYAGGDFYLLEIQLPIGQVLPRYPLLDNPSIALRESDIDSYTHSYLFSLICNL